MQKNKINKQRGSILLALLPLLILFSASFAAPLITTSLVQTLADSPVYQNLFGSDAVGVSYNNPTNIVLGKGDKMLNVPCADQSEWGHCGRASVLMILRFYKPNEFNNITTAQLGGGSLVSKLTGNIGNITGSWYTGSWDFGKAQKSIDQGYPVIIYTGRYFSSKNQYGHIMVIIGYKNNGSLIINSSTLGGCKTEVHSIAEIQSWGGHKVSGEDYGGKQMIFSTKVN
jgi:hypothetical protein